MANFDIAGQQLSINDFPNLPSIGSDTDSDDSFEVLNVEPSIELSHGSETKRHYAEIVGNIIQETDQEINNQVPLMPPIENHFTVKSEEDPSIDNLSVGLSQLEIEQKIDSLIKENVELKKILVENNKAISAWHIEVNKTYDDHKQKFAEAKKMLERSYDDNTKMAKQLLHKDLVIEKLERQVEIPTEELRQMKDTEIKQLNSIITSLNNQIAGMMKQGSEESVKLEEQNAELLGKIMTLSKEVLDLKKMLADANEDINRKVQCIINLEHHIQSLNEVRAEELKKRTEDNASWKENEMQALFEKIHNLKQELNTVNHAYDEVCAVNKELLAEISIERNKHRALSDELLSLSEDYNKVRQQLARAQEEITVGKHTLGAYREQIHGKEAEIQQLIEQLNSYSGTEDHIAALNSQIELCKADFLEESRAKQAYRDEKAQLAEDLQNLTIRNRELQEELDVIRNHSGLAYPSRSGNTSTRGRASAPPHQPTFNCPTCHFKFTTYQAAVNHANKCLDMNETLP